MKTVGALIFPGFEVLDLYGPLEMFGLLMGEMEIRIVAEQAEPVASGAGPRTAVDDLMADRDDYDIILVPGGGGTRQEVNNQALLDWIVSASAKAELTTAVCTGSALLARAGVLDGRKATTNKAAYAWATSQGPNVAWQPQARWVEDGKFMTSSGVSAGTDMGLAIVARLFGAEKAEQVAVFAEYEWRRDSSWDPFAKVHGLV
ncbi:MAG: DJ-1/PfpI family protein [Pseudomonadota bacterium]